MTFECVNPKCPGHEFEGATCYVVRCDQCGALHDAVRAHDGSFGEGPLFAVVCTVDHLTDYYTAERLEIRAKS